MAIKTVRVEATQGSGYEMKVRAGNHTVTIDQPEPAGNDAAPNPLEYFLVSLAGCVGAVARIIAGQRKIDLKGISLTVEGELDSDRLLGKTTDERAGFTEIRVKADFDSDMTPEEKSAFLMEVDSRCPVSDVMLNGTKVKFETRSSGL